MLRLIMLFAALSAIALTSRISAAQAAPASTDKLRVACVGDSITYGSRIVQREKFSYPARLQEMLGARYDVRNFGVSGATLLKQGNKPYWNQKAYRQALDFQPGIVVIKLGTNDSKTTNWEHKADFAPNATELIASFRALPSKPRVLLCLPMPAFKVNYDIHGDVITSQTIPLLRQVAYATNTELVDLHTPHLDKTEWFPDGIHPDARGAESMAKIIREVIEIKPDAAFDIEKNLAAQGITSKASSFFGYRCLDFNMDARRCKIVAPRVTAAGRPFAWRAEFFGNQPQTDLALLERGWHIVYCNVMGLMGGPPAMSAWEQFHALIAKSGLDGKAVFIGLSRGGLYSFNWAALHPETVACIYADAPVCDMKSWPAGKGKGQSSKKDWALVIKNYGFKDEAEALAYKKNPVDNLAPLAKAKIPLLLVAGTADKTVPIEENTDIIEQHYKALGGTVTVIRKPGADHHPHSLPNPQPIVDFILSSTVNSH